MRDQFQNGNVDWANIVQVEEVRQEYCNQFLDHGYILLAVFIVPWYRQAEDGFRDRLKNVLYVVGRPVSVRVYAPERPRDAFPRPERPMPPDPAGRRP